MKKNLEIGKNYGPIFGLTSEMGSMVYNGGNSWTATKAGGQAMTQDSAKTTERALEYLNRPSHGTGLR